MFPVLITADFSGPGFLERLRCRDRGALRDLADAYLPQVYRAARGAGLGPSDAEDVTQNTFVTFVEKIHEFEGRSHIRTWLFGILYHKISEMRRMVQRSEATEDIDEVVESRFKANGLWARPPRAADEKAYAAEVRNHLADCLEGLTTDQRLAFVMREVEEMESGEICEALEVSRSNLGVLLFRGRNRLRECLEQRNVEG